MNQISSVLLLLLLGCTNSKQEPAEEGSGKASILNPVDEVSPPSEAEFAEMFDAIDKAHKAYPEMVPTSRDAEEAAAVCRFASSVVDVAATVNWSVRKNWNIVVVYGDIPPSEQKELVNALTAKKEEMGWDPIYLRVVKARVKSVITSTLNGRKMTTGRHEPEKEVVLFEAEIL
jgi:hypothetical protein